MERPHEPMPEHLRAAMERARANPMPRGLERDRVLALVAEVKSDPVAWRTHEEVMADLEAHRGR
jgi:hypothetical protein